MFLLFFSRLSALVCVFNLLLFQVYLWRQRSCATWETVVWLGGYISNASHSQGEYGLDPRSWLGNISEKEATERDWTNFKRPARLPKCQWSSDSGLSSILELGLD